MLQVILILSVNVFQAISYQPNQADPAKHIREARQLGGLLGSSNQSNRRGPVCVGPNNINGRCLPMEQCVLKELDDDYIKNKGFLCALRPEGPVGVCCPNSITNPTVYREGMFSIKNIGLAKAGEPEDPPVVIPEDVETLE